MKPGRTRTVVAPTLAVAVAWLAACGAAAAHDFSITDTLVLLKTDGTYQIDMTVDVDALATGSPPRSDSREIVERLESMSAAEFEATVEGVAETIARRVRLRFDGEKQTPLVTFPELDHPPETPREPPTVLGTTARLTGSVPEGTVEMTFGASRAFGPVRLTILDQSTASGLRLLLEPGADSAPFFPGRPPEASVPAPSIAASYLVLGFEHILPKGLDHILFVLGLFLLSTRPRSLLLQITAFTVAHSVTLGLCMAGVLAVPSRVVESLIALSIVYVAVENMVTDELKPWRPALVFCFGLLHGLGFAGVLQSLGTPEGELVKALVSFNVGVEGGQLAVVLLAFLIVGWFRHRAWYRAGIVRPLSGGIALVGLYWTVVRAFAA